MDDKKELSSRTILIRVAPLTVLAILFAAIFGYYSNGVTGAIASGFVAALALTIATFIFIRRHT